MSLSCKMQICIPCARPSQEKASRRAFFQCFACEIHGSRARRTWEHSFPNCSSLLSKRGTAHPRRGFAKRSFGMPSEQNPWCHGRGPLQKRLPERYFLSVVQSKSMFQGTGPTPKKHAKHHFLNAFQAKSMTPGARPEHENLPRGISWQLFNEKLIFGYPNDALREGTRRAQEVHTPLCRGCAHDSLVNDSFHNL